MTRFERFRVSLATWLVKNTSCLVARREPTIQMCAAALRLRTYIEASGGLQDPRRIRAYRVILRDVEKMHQYMTQVVAGPVLPISTQEESHGPTQEASAAA